jgi:hypothetical protein
MPITKVPQITQARVEEILRDLHNSVNNFTEVVQKKQKKAGIKLRK